MRRILFSFAVVGLLSGFAMSDSASACCWHKKTACAPAPAPVACEPCAAPAPVACAPAPKKHCFGGFKMPKMSFGCHKKAVACETVAYSPCETAAPVTYAAPQTWSAPQALPTMSAPQK